jgi:hypothetical protein
MGLDYCATKVSSQPTFRKPVLCRRKMDRAPVGIAPRYLSLILRPLFADFLALKRILPRRDSPASYELSVADSHPAVCRGLPGIIRV